MCTKYDDQAKLWTYSEEYPLKDVSDWKWVWKSIVTHGSKVAQINADTGVKMTFSEIRLNAIRAAQNLLKRGFGPRQKFCFMSINSDHLVSLILASMGLVCPIVPLFPILSKDEIVQILVKVQPKVIFCDAKLYDLLKEALNELKFNIKLFILDGHVDGIESVDSLLTQTGEEDSFAPMECVVEKDLMGIFCSSGTTGPSKCACLPYSVTTFKPLKHDADTVFYSCDTIYWTVGCRPIFHTIYNGVTRIISAQPFSPARQLEIVEKYKVTDLYNTPFIMTACLKSDTIQKANLSSVKRILSYGGKLPESLITEIKRYFPNGKLFNYYGLTETGGISLGNVDDNNGSCGKLCADCTIKVIDEDGNRCGPNVNGEIHIKTENQFLGYLNDPVATSAAIDDEGFFRTGDIGHLDNDGKLFIEDRKKNVMTVFYFESVLIPANIEDCLIKMPGIKEVCVVGIKLAIDAYLPAAVVIKNPNSNLNQRDVFNVVAENFANGLRLRGGVYFVDSLPRTHNGKLIRNKITKMGEELFKATKQNDPDIQKYLSEIPDEYKKLITI